MHSRHLCIELRHDVPQCYVVGGDLHRSEKSLSEREQRSQIFPIHFEAPFRLGKHYLKLSNVNSTIFIDVDAVKGGLRTTECILRFRSGAL